MTDIYDASDPRIKSEYRELQYWNRGFDVAKCWYHEEWDGSYIQLDLARDIAKAIANEVQTVLLDYV